MTRYTHGGMWPVQTAGINQSEGDISAPPKPALPVCSVLTFTRTEEATESGKGKLILNL